MKNDILKILRYNTGNDKKVFLKFKDFFDIAVINANIVAYSSTTITDLISIHKKNYIIDPQTHIFQHNPVQVSSAKTGKIKQSIMKFLDEIPKEIRDIFLKRAILPEEIINHIDNLVKSIYDFQINFISKRLDAKEYNEYLEFMNISLLPKYIIAPYFMIKDDYDFNTKKTWLEINKMCIEKIIQHSSEFNKDKIAVQLVIEKESLLDDKILDELRKTYNMSGYEYVFLWIDEFYSFTATFEENQAFKKLILLFNSMNKKVVNIYGGYDSILMCHDNSPCKLYGVAQSSGYGEHRKITPVGGGIPTNKYYFLPTHFRMDSGEVDKILNNKGYFGKETIPSEKASLYYKNICECQQCKAVIKDDMSNFKSYLDSKPFIVNLKNVSFQRNKSTQEAKLISEMHFMYCKKKEWENIANNEYNVLIKEIQENNSEYGVIKEEKIKKWLDIFGK